MTLNNPVNFKVTEHRNGDKCLYILIADEGYCFRNKTEPIKDDDGNVCFKHSSAFTLLDYQIDKLADYDCITIEEAEKEKVPEDFSEAVDENAATEEDYINALEELGVTFDE